MNKTAQLEWMAGLYDDSCSTQELASRLYDVSCMAEKLLAAAPEPSEAEQRAAGLEKALQSCAECKTMRRVYRAAMKWHKHWSRNRMPNVIYVPYPEYQAMVFHELWEACAAAKKGKK